MVVCFSEFLTLLLWGAITFSFLIRLLWLLLCQMCKEEGFKIYLDTRNNEALPLDPVCLERLNVWSLIDLPYFFKQFVEYIFLLEIKIYFLIFEDIIEIFNIKICKMTLPLGPPFTCTHYFNLKPCNSQSGVFFIKSRLKLNTTILNAHK